MNYQYHVPPCHKKDDLPENFSISDSKIIIGVTRVWLCV